MKNILIIGAGDLGKELVWLIEDINRVSPTYVILGFLDDDGAKFEGEFYGYRVLGGIDMLEKLSEEIPLYAVIAIQDGDIRHQIVEKHQEFTRWESIVHPTAVIAQTSPVNTGCILFPRVTISVDTKLGMFGLYYVNAIVCDDCTIGDYVTMMSGATVLEHTEIGDGCFLSAGSYVPPHRRIEAHTNIKIGLVVANHD